MGAPVPIFARLVAYVKEVIDILAASVGNAPAQARKFLRRVEQNQLSGLTSRSGVSLTAECLKKNIFSRRLRPQTMSPELA